MFTIFMPNMCFTYVCACNKVILLSVLDESIHILLMCEVEIESRCLLLGWASDPLGVTCVVLGTALLDCWHSTPT